jgi:hypothetical protein
MYILSKETGPSKFSVELEAVIRGPLLIIVTSERERDIYI